MYCTYLASYFIFPASRGTCWMPVLYADDVTAMHGPSFLLLYYTNRKVLGRACYILHHSTAYRTIIA